MASDEEVIAQLKPLFEWLQDGNWPVYDPVCQRVAHLGMALEPYLRNILNGNDEGWKYFIGSGLLHNVDRELILSLMDLLQRIAFTPTESEYHEQVDEVVQNFLLSFNSEGCNRNFLSALKYEREQIFRLRDQLHDYRMYQSLVSYRLQHETPEHLLTRVSPRYLHDNLKAPCISLKTANPKDPWPDTFLAVLLELEQMISTKVVREDTEQKDINASLLRLEALIRQRLSTPFASIQ